MVLESVGQETEVDLSSVIDVWKETSVPASAIEVGDRLFVNGTRGPSAFVARYVHANIGRLDGVVISVDGDEMVIGILRYNAPIERRVKLSAHVEIVHLEGGGQLPAGRADLTPGREVGMVLYSPRDALPRATRIWLSPQTPAPSASPENKVLTRPAVETGRSVAPVGVNAVPAAGRLVMRLGGTWWYEGRTGAVIAFPMVSGGTEHPSPAGRLIAVERLRPIGRDGTYLIAKELAVREQGVERVIYRAPADGFYWSGWSPDGRYVALWEIGMYSGSLDMDGRPLVVIDTQTGQRTDLGKTLLHGTTSWTAPHTLAFISGAGRMVWDTKTLRLWSPESGTRDITGADVAAFAPAWSADGRSLWFVSGPAGRWDPLEAVAGRGVGDRRVGVWDAATGSIRALAHEMGYVEEGVRPSRDGTHLLVLRRQTAVATDVASIPNVDLEVWLIDADGSHGEILARFPGSGLSAYGYQTGPSEWDWSE
ncbi:MAG: WD40 repeat domain-containing protein [Candidatus Limnocylindria bacterium]